MADRKEERLSRVGAERENTDWTIQCLLQLRWRCLCTMCNNST